MAGRSTPEAWRSRAPHTTFKRAAGVNDECRGRAYVASGDRQHHGAAGRRWGSRWAGTSILACLGVGLPGLILFMEWRGQRTGDVAYRLLGPRLARALGVLFAVGAVSGTILSFEMGLLWSGLMEHYGSVIGLPFAIEGFRLLRRSDLSRHLLVWLGSGSRRAPICCPGSR